MQRQKKQIRILFFFFYSTEVLFFSLSNYRERRVTRMSLSPLLPLLLLITTQPDMLGQYCILGMAYSKKKKKERWALLFVSNSSHFGLYAIFSPRDTIFFPNDSPQWGYAAQMSKPSKQKGLISHYFWDSARKRKKNPSLSDACVHILQVLKWKIFSTNHEAGRVERG